jgi:uncharacterized protein
MPIHVAITRRVRPGREAEFQSALKEFFASSFGHEGVHGASLLAPPIHSPSPEFGILRSFANARERDEFYSSPMFQAWEARIQPLTDGKPVYRELTGLEAWFRSPRNPPPRWKMALLTWLAVWPVSMAMSAVLKPLLSQRVPGFIYSGAIAGGIVVVLSWVAMPLLVKLTQRWLLGHPSEKA